MQCKNLAGWSENEMHGQTSQQAFALPVYSISAQKDQFTLNEQEAVVKPEVYDGATEQSEHHVRPGLSTSARRRQRRLRAAEKRGCPASVRAIGCELQLYHSDPTDSIGHLDCAALTAALEDGSESRAVALATIRGSMAQLAFDLQGCRLVQAAIQVADHAIIAELLTELNGRVRDASTSPHANYVIQAVITALPTAMSTFVVKELKGVGAEIACHRFGCRILCRLIEHSGTSGDLDDLLREILADAEDLCQHSFGHYVLQCILEHLPEHRQRIVEALHADLWGNACHRCASHVVESALAHCSDADRQGFVLQILGQGRDAVVSLAQNQYGSFVLKALLQVPGKVSEEAWSHLSQAVACLEGTKYGQRLVQDLRLGAATAA